MYLHLHLHQVNYNLGLANGPDWYKLLWVRHVTTTKGWDEDKIHKWIVR